ncbi:MAG: flavodoxin family protein, partial [Candidatus Bathyarchaeia archaeon]
MVKILGVVCSMRPNGNTEKLVKHALNVAAEKGAETELLSLRDKKIEYCDSDFSCV